MPLEELEKVIGQQGEDKVENTREQGRGARHLQPGQAVGKVAPHEQHDQHHQLHADHDAQHSPQQAIDDAEKQRVHRCLEGTRQEIDAQCDGDEDDELLCDDNKVLLITLYLC